MTRKTARSEEGGPGDNVPRIGLAPKPAAACGGNRQAKRGELQGVSEAHDYASSPGRKPSVPHPPQAAKNSLGAMADVHKTALTRKIQLWHLSQGIGKQ